jgi:hypothetical protein
MSLDVSHELLVQLAGKPDTKRKFLEAGDSVLKSAYVIANFPKIFGTAIHYRSRLGGKQLTQRSLGAFNPAG